MEDKFQIQKTIKGNLPRLPFLDMKEKVLGKNYNLSLVFVADKLSRKLNKQYRNKDYVPNVLSFPYSKSEGEIFINLKKSRQQAPEYGRDFNNFIAFLFIHALFHLKGHDHGSRMESEEKKVRSYFKLD